MIRSRVSRAVVLGTFFVSLTAACAGEQDSGQSWICEDAAGVRLPDEDCPEDDEGGFGHEGKRKYYPSGTYIPAVGSRVPPGGSYSRPSGSVGKVPSSGGFGSHGGSSGS